MNIKQYLSPNIVQECIIQESKRKVILKFTDGDVEVAIAEPEDEFNPEVGILWATMKHFMKRFGTCSAHKYVEYCLELDTDRKQRKVNGEHSNKDTDKNKKIQTQSGNDSLIQLIEETIDDLDNLLMFDIETDENIEDNTIYCNPKVGLVLFSLLGYNYGKVTEV